MDEDYPIDIHYNKLLDWLLSRRHCDAKWHVHAKVMRSRVSAALKNLPLESEELKKILQDNTLLNYFECQEVFTIVKTLDGDNKTLFGQYTAPRVKEWAGLIKSYEEGNVYLAECGQQLARMVNYEIPHLKHQISKCQQIRRDSLRQEEELRTSAASLKEKYEASCQEMGIKGVNVKVELSHLLYQLPVVYEQVLQLLPNLLPTISFYQDFLQSLGSVLREDQLLPMLSYILKNGNVTVYQWKHGQVPDQNQTSIRTENESEEISIDWGLDSALVSRGDDGIDFGGIDFGEMDKACEEGMAVITLEESGVASELEGGMTSETGEESGGVVSVEVSVETQLEYSAEDLQLLLESPSTRNQFQDDLLELREFLSQRITELNSNATSAVQMLCVEEFGEASSSKEMEAMLGHVTAVLDHMTNKKVQHLFHMKGSQRYLQRLSEELTHNLRLSNRAISQCLETAARREQAGTTLDTLQPQYTALVERTKKLQAQMSAEISHRYKNRIVNIMGEINQI